MGAVDLQYRRVRRHDAVYAGIDNGVRKSAREVDVRLD